MTAEAAAGGELGIRRHARLTQHRHRRPLHATIRVEEHIRGTPHPQDPHAGHYERVTGGAPASGRTTRAG
ncbi:hypothetical protein GCM10017786_03470 [Amycolatopsis deserti]|uniref:Uncharacterized protein n=1 Tax=Amycolatopsis deserti TaxID=185696 RepID=A0ABQ3IE04_9PSEU|nr:hypothetical protein GCM10017786_03470 [Amycolatopsis deserti]